jgi:hypothetical protein
MAEKRITGRYEEIGSFIGSMVDRGNIAGSGTFHETAQVVHVLYPQRINPEQYDDLLAIIRMIDSMFMISREKKSSGKTPYYMDIVCHAIRKCQDLNVGVKKHEEPGR